MKCEKFIKNGGGRGRPPYDARCHGCGVIYTDHPNESRDRYSKALQTQGIRGVSSISAAPVTTVVPSQIVSPIKV